MPELQTPNLITPYQGLTFLAGLAAERARQAELRDRNVLALQRMGQQMEIQNERTQTTLQVADMRHQAEMERADNAAKHWQDIYDLGSRANEIKDERTQLYRDRLTAKLDDDYQKLKQQRVNLFKSEQMRYGLPTDAFENDKMTDDTNSAGWHRDPEKPGQRYYNAPMYDAQGQPTGKMTPITITDKTYDWLKSTYKDMQADPPTRKITDPDAPPTLRDRAQAALNDPDATPAEKDAAKKILAAGGS